MNRATRTRANAMQASNPNKAAPLSAIANPNENCSMWNILAGRY